MIDYNNYSFTRLTTHAIQSFHSRNHNHEILKIRVLTNSFIIKARHRKTSVVRYYRNNDRCFENFNGLYSYYTHLPYIAKLKFNTKYMTALIDKAEKKPLVVLFKKPDISHFDSKFDTEEEKLAAQKDAHDWVTNMIIEMLVNDINFNQEIKKQFKR